VARQQGLDAPEEFHITDWLRDVVISTELQNISGYFLFADIAENDGYGPPRIFADMSQYFAAANVGQRPINYEKIKAAAFQLFQAGHPVTENGHFIGFTGKYRLENFCLDFIVCNDRNFHGRLVSISNSIKLTPSCR
jgi:hypothetical protein